MDILKMDEASDGNYKRYFATSWKTQSQAVKETARKRERERVGGGGGGVRGEREREREMEEEV